MWIITMLNTIKEIIKNRLRGLFESIIGEEFAKIEVLDNYEVIDKNGLMINNKDTLIINEEECIYDNSEEFPKILNKFGERVFFDCYPIYKIRGVKKKI